MNYIPEKKIEDQINAIPLNESYKLAKKICKIKCENGIGTGFFCDIIIDEWDHLLRVRTFITNRHVLNEDDIKPGKKIKFSLNDEEYNYEIEIDNERKKYSSKKYDVTIIEIKKEDNIKSDSFLEIDDNLYNTDCNYKNTSIYLLHYPKGKEISLSQGKIQNVGADNKYYEIEHDCNSEPGSSGGPLINSNNFKVIGIHKGASIEYNFNSGTLLKEPIIEFQNIIKNIDNKKKGNNNKMIDNIEEKNVKAVKKNYLKGLIDMDKLEEKIKNLNYERNSLMSEIEKLKKKKKIIQKEKEKYTEINVNIRNQEETINKLKGEEFKTALIKLNDNIDEQLCELKNRIMPKKIKKLVKDSNKKYTICYQCSNNCHDPCNCSFKFLNRICSVFPIFSNECEICGHNNSVHENGDQHYVWETLRTGNIEPLSQLQKNKKEIENDLEKANKEILEKEKSIKEKEKEISFIIVRLHNCEKLKEITMNPNVFKTENEYYKYLKDEMKEIGIKDEEQEEYLNKIIKESESLEKK